MQAYARSSKMRTLEERDLFGWCVSGVGTSVPSPAPNTAQACKVDLLIMLMHRSTLGEAANITHTI